MRAVAVRDVANQLSLGGIAPTTSFVRRHKLIFCAATPKHAARVERRLSAILAADVAGYSRLMYG
jgi:hypothetical protein